MIPESHVESGVDRGDRGAYSKVMTATLEGTAVLVADDDPDNLELLAYIMSAEGATVRTASSASAAIELLPDWRPDVLLLDIEMPSMDGYELLSFIRSQDGLHNVPAVAVTGRGYPTDKERAFEAGFDAHMTKPFDGLALVELIEWLAAPSNRRSTNPGRPSASVSRREA
jgi:CheY-like chemotaxis protein